MGPTGSRFCGQNLENIRVGGMGGVRFFRAAPVKSLFCWSCAFEAGVGPDKILSVKDLQLRDCGVRIWRLVPFVPLLFGSWQDRTGKLWKARSDVTGRNLKSVEFVGVL
jgi:hypothetical protein